MLVPQPALPAWWLDEALEAEGTTPESSSLTTDLDVDVAIVGGGYTGYGQPSRSPSAIQGSASLCSRPRSWAGGRAAETAGSSVGTTEAWTQLRRLFGTHGALAVAGAGARIVPAIREFSERRGEDLWLREEGYLRISCAPTQDAGIDAVVDAARSLGIDDDVVQPLSPAEVQDRCRSPRFRNGVLVRDTATVQPADSPGLSGEPSSTWACRSASAPASSS